MAVSSLGAAGTQLNNTSNPLSDVSALGTLLGLVKGTSSSQTSSSNISQAGMQALINQMLGNSNSGIAAIASGTKTAGGYNSATQTLLQNDLVSRSAAQLAAQQAGTTTSTSTPAKLGPSGLLTLGGSLAASSILGPSVKAGLNATGISGLGETLKNKLFGQTSGGAASGTGADVAGGSQLGFGGAGTDVAATNTAVIPGSLAGATADLTGATAATQLGLDAAAAPAADAIGTAATGAGLDTAGTAAAVGTDAGLAAAGSGAVDAGLTAAGTDAAAAAGGGDAIGTVLSFLGFL